MRATATNLEVRLRLGCVFFVLCVLWPLVASPHAGHGASGEGTLLDGLLHPVTGLDHVAAMVAVGLWGAQLGAPAIWLLPVTFPLVMAVGGFLGVVGVPLPGAVTGVAMSCVVLGTMVAMTVRPSLYLAALAVGIFAIFHGHAHGAAMPLSGAPLAFGAGFIIATGLLHLCGVSFGLLVRWQRGALAVRLGGLAIALVGLFYVGTLYLWPMTE